MSHRHIIGLTGGYCSGKNQVGKSIASRGFNVIDADLLAHEALSMSAPRLAETFGRGVLAPDGSVDRRALGAIVFADKAALRLHESIVHPVIMKLLDDEIDKSGDVCINATLLYRYPYEVEKCDFIIEVRASLCTRLRRGKRRDGFGAREVLRRVLSQRYLWKMRPAGSPEVVFLNNNGNPQELEKRVVRLLEKKIVLH